MRTGRPRKRVFDEVAALDEYKRSGSSAEVAKVFGTGPDVILRLAKKNGMEIGRRGARRMLSDAVVQEAKRSYEEGRSQSQIADAVGMSQQGIGKVLLREGVAPRRTKAWATVDEGFFDVIDTEEKAYWLGFMLADGWVLGRGVVGLALKWSDAGHVQKFAVAVKYKGRMRRRVGTYGETAVVSFRSVHMIGALVSYGIVQAKSLRLEGVPQVDVELQKHMWRGIVDGDGCLGDDGIKLASGSKAVCEEFMRYVRGCGIGVGKIGYDDREGHACYHVAVYGENGAKLARLLYEEAKVSLDRKMAIAAEWCGFESPLEVRWIRRDEAALFLEMHHYLRSVSSYAVCLGGYLAGDLVGVAALAQSSSRFVAESIFGRDDAVHVVELSRFCVRKGTQKNLSSMFLARVMREVKEKYPDWWGVVSFADSAQGHYGTIYQAANARYLGMTGEELVVVLPDGRKVTGRYAVEKLRDVDLKRCSVERSGGKYKYVFLLRYEERCKAGRVPFPKKLNKKL